MLKKRIAFLMLFTFFLMPFSVMAEKVQKESVVGYSVTPQLPDNQINEKVTYFDLMMKPNQKQTIKIKIFNTSQNEIKVNPSIHNGETNRNGIIDYSNEIEPIDSSLKVPLSSIMKLKETEVVVPKGEQKTIEAEINMPQHSSDGVILGGVRFEKEATEKEVKEESVQIKNKYAYVVGVQLRYNENEVKPNLNLVEIEPTLVNYRTSVIARIQNDKPTIIGELAVDAKVFTEKGKDVLHETENNNLKMEPNSTIDYVIDWDNQRLEPGKYRLEMKAKSKEDTWKWKEYFEIDSDKADGANKEAVDLEDDGIDSWIWMVIGIAILIILLLLIIIWRMKKSQKKNDNDSTDE